jgi:pyruvate dehydrogenase E1 component alpha subunit
MSDPVSGVYRTKEDVEKERANDPITLFADLLARNDILSQKELEEMDAEVKRISEEAAEFAESSPEPSLDHVYTDIYSTEDVNGRMYFDMRGER